MSSRNTPAAAPSNAFLTSNQLRARWGGRSSMYLPRLQAKDPTFPKPIRFGGGRFLFWRLDEIERWESDQQRTAS